MNAIFAVSITTVMFIKTDWYYSEKNLHGRKSIPSRCRILLQPVKITVTPNVKKSAMKMEKIDNDIGKLLKVQKIGAL